MSAPADDARGKDHLGLVLGFMSQLWALDHALRSASRRMRGRLGVTGPQRLVIRIVGRRPGISAGELAGVLCVHPSTLTGVLRRLCERGLLRRGQDARDRRRTVLRLTPKGLRIDRALGGTVEAALRPALARTPHGELVIAARVLTALTSALLPQRTPIGLARRKGHSQS